MSDAPALSSVPRAPHAAAAKVALSTTLVLRACVNGTFAIWALAFTPGWFEIFWIGSVYALVDGALGIATTMLLIRRRPVGAPPLLVAMVLADALLRVMAGVLIRVFPGLPDNPLTAVLFFGVLAGWAAVAGITAIVAWLIAHEFHHVRRALSPVRAVFDPLSGAGLIALALAAYAIVRGPPATAEALSACVAAATAAQMLVFMVAVAVENHTL